MCNYNKGSKRLGIVLLLAYWIVVSILFIDEVVNAPEHHRNYVYHSDSYGNHSNNYLFISYKLSSDSYGKAALEPLDEKYRNCINKPDKSISTEEPVLSKEQICSSFTSEEYSLSKEIDFISVFFSILIVPIIFIALLFTAIYTVKLFSRVVVWVRDGFRS
jgi:hypothetical protein